MAQSRSPHGERGLKSTGDANQTGSNGSLPPRGAWIEIYAQGMPRKFTRSLPPRGAWIEICGCFQKFRRARSLPPRGAWIEMKNGLVRPVLDYSRSPHGERGLK